MSTVEKRFGLTNLTARDKAAPDVASVLTLGDPRTDDPLRNQAIPKASQQPAFKKSVSHLELSLAELAGHVPITDETGDIRQTETPPIRTADDALNFAHQRNKELRDNRDGFEKRPRRKGMQTAR